MRFLFVFFIIIPLLEMLLLFEVADLVGGFPTVAMVVLTAIIGVQILKRQGLSTLVRANERLNAGQLPAEEIIEGMLLAAAGALLLTPGFITDTLGFVFLTGPLRRPLAARLVKTGMVKAASMNQNGGGFQFHSSASFHGAPASNEERDAMNRAGGTSNEGAVRYSKVSSLKNPVT